ncbi:hypothetical protein SASPL_108330 [Salvia splendens]|uniref:Uncharacterized protein n=1 Tax=Salvia splendens TaxID=180675 RepID=A0A8X8YCW3_SALSN|nr:hypothetical protein SASPL_108330 [Salvia splendens]
MNGVFVWRWKSSIGASTPTSQPERKRARLEDGEGVGGGDGDLVHPFHVEGLHGGNKVVDEVLWAPVEDLVAHDQIVDVCVRVEGLDVGGDPAAGGLGGGEGGDLVVGDSDGDQDAGVGEGAEDVGIDVEDLYAVYGCFVLEELRHLGWRREVVAEGAVVDADRMDGAGGSEEPGAS